MQWYKIDLHADPSIGSRAEPLRRFNVARLILYLTIVCAFSVNVFGQSALTVVSDQLTLPNGTHPTGTAIISWTRATNDANPRRVIFPGSQTINITNGVINVSLFPNAAMLPPSTCYGIQYSLNGTRSTRYWYVPISPSPVSLNIVESSVACPPSSTGMIAPAQISNAGAVLGNALVWNGNYWAPGLGGGGGGGSGSAIYTTAVTNQTTVTITAVTHNQGVHPFAIAFRASDGQDVQAVYNCKTSGGAPIGCAAATSNGDIVFNFNPPFTGSIEIGGGGNGNGGGSGNFNANQLLGQPITSLLGNSGILVQGIGPYTSGHLGSFDANGNLIDSTIPAVSAVLTTGSYADPAWITSLSTAKLSGALLCPQMPLFTGDVTKLAGSCATLVTTTNGIGFSPSATIDATNGNNITSGTVAGARMAATNLAASGNGGVTGNLQAVNVNGGVNADTTHFLRGDMTWVSVAGAGTVTNSSGPLFAGQLIVGNGSNDATPIGTLGSTTTVYHGNAGGTGSFLPVSMTADVTGILPSANGGTGNAFFLVNGPAGGLRAFTFPNVSSIVLTTAVPVTPNQGGTGFDSSGIAKGGIITGTGFGVFGITTVGTNGFILSADSSQAGGVKWITNAAGTGTVTSITCSAPLVCTPNPITATGTLTSPTVVTSAAALTLNGLVIGGGLQATSVLGSLGTTTTLLHGNAAGPPSYGAVGLTTDVTGTLPFANGGLGLTTGTQTAYLRVAPNITTPTLQFSPPPQLISSDYNFPSQSPGGSLAIGNNTITMTPVPLGLNGSDTNHYVYVSGGVGTAEACLINGGAGTAGSSSGSIQMNCANTHSGAWTVQSATAGIQEALVNIHTTAGITGYLWVPSLATIHAPIFVYAEVQGLFGARGVLLTAAADHIGPSMVIGASGLARFTYSGIDLNPALVASITTVINLSRPESSIRNTLTGFQIINAPNNSTMINLDGCEDSDILDVQLLNPGGTGTKALAWHVSGGNIRMAGLVTFSPVLLQAQVAGIRDSTVGGIVSDGGVSALTVENVYSYLHPVSHANFSSTGAFGFSNLDVIGSYLIAGVINGTTFIGDYRGVINLHGTVIDGNGAGGVTAFSSSTTSATGVLFNINYNPYLSTAGPGTPGANVLVAPQTGYGVLYPPFGANAYTGVLNNVAAIGNTNLLTGLSVGLYRVDWTIATGSTNGTGTAQIQINWFDGVATRGAASSVMTLSAGAVLSGSALAQPANGTIAYQTGFTAGSGGTYDVWIAITKLE